MARQWSDHVVQLAFSPFVPASTLNRGTSQLAMKTPATQAASDRVQLSNRNSRMIRQRPPPKASRMLTSRFIPSIRTSIRFVAFRQAIPYRKPTAPTSIQYISGRFSFFSCASVESMGVLSAP